MLVRMPSQVREMKQFQALWQGTLDLGEAFWTWAIFGGLVVNLATSILFLVLITFDFPWLAVLVGYGCSLPYNLVALVGVWRSSARYGGPKLHADLARGATAVLMVVLSLT